MKIEQSIYNMCKDFIKYVERDKVWWGRVVNFFAEGKFKQKGMCGCYGSYIIENKPYMYITDYFTHYGYEDIIYPFGGFNVFHTDYILETMHKNPQRIAFAERIIKDYEEQ